MNNVNNGGLLERMQAEIIELRTKVEALEGFRYEQLERKHLGDFEKKTGIYVVTPQQRRDEIVEKAKRDVAELFAGRTGYPVTTVDGHQRRMNKYAHYVDYVIKRDKRTVTAVVKYKDDDSVRVVGRSKCAPDDCFNVHIGKAVALRRALGLEVPSEYTNAPHPTEVRVGDVCRGIDARGNLLTVTAGERLEMMDYEGHGRAFKVAGKSGCHFGENQVNIIDDSRE